MRVAYEAWAELLRGLIAPPQPGKVVTMKRRVGA